MLRPLLAGVLLLLAWSSPAFGASSDFNGDGLADLAVGIPYEDVGAVVNAGAVQIVYGVPAGPGPATPYQFFTQSSANVEDTAEANDHFGWSVAAGDFNGDGYDDLAIGAPGESLVAGEPPTARNNAGVVHVIYGTPTGLNPSGTKPDDVFTEAPTAPTESESNDRFGYSLATANFGYGRRDDLAVGVPGETITAVGTGAQSAAGAVKIFYGMADGLDLTPDEIQNNSFHQGMDLRNELNAGDSFGHALAAADFGKSNHAELAIGVPGEGASNTGAVAILHGSADGLSTAGDQLWTQNSRGIRDGADNSEAFGASLAAANFGRSSRADLAVGVPGEFSGRHDGAGAVNVIYGNRRGLAAAGNQIWHQASPGIAGRTSDFESLGIAVTAANFGRSSHADLAVSSIDDAGDVPNAGSVNVIYGTAAGLSAAGDQLWHQDSPGIESDAALGEGFGHALAAGNFGHGPNADLAIAVLGEDVEGIDAAGAVAIIYGRPGGLGAANDVLVHQNNALADDGAEASDFFGYSLAPRNGGLGINWST